MKLTVGPLPAAVYWRRRAIVFGVLLLATLMLWASCGGEPDKNPTSQPANERSSTGSSPTATSTVLVPSTGSPETPSASSTPAAPATTTAAPVDPAVPPCADTDLSLVAAPETAVQFRGAYIRFFLRIKNISARDCVRDLGADHQELYLQSGATKIWSSDVCDAPKGSELKTLKPNVEVEYNNNWNGKATNNGCANREAPAAGKYQLVGRLGTKLSDPVQVHLT